MTLLWIAYALVVLHRVDGGQVWINPHQVTSLRVVDGALSAQIGGGRCIIGLTDRKFISVLESCAKVRQLIEK